MRSRIVGRHGETPSYARREISLNANFAAQNCPSLTSSPRPSDTGEGIVKWGELFENGDTPVYWT